jgi:Universal stress protein family
VLLATLEAPFEPAAAEIAVDAAIESGKPLLVVVLARLEPLPLSVMLGYDMIESPAQRESFRAPAELAASFGVVVELLRVRSPRPVDALLELVAEQRPGLLVFGPDRSAISRRTYTRAVDAIRARAPCLVWVTDEAAYPSVNLFRAAHGRKAPGTDSRRKP